MISPPLHLTCHELREFLPGGVTKPLLVKAHDADGNDWTMVLKLRYPWDAPPDAQYGGTSLACELICAMLWRALGMLVPNYAVVTLPAALADSVSDQRVRELLARNVGENFGSEFMRGFGEWSASHVANSEELIHRLESVLTFDATVINGDRRREKPNLLWRGDQLAPIDHALALIVHRWEEHVIATSPLFPEQHVRRHCAFQALNQKGNHFEDLLAMWRSRIGDEQLQEIRSHIPGGWEETQGDLDKIFGFLSARSARFAEVSADLRRVVR